MASINTKQLFDQAYELQEERKATLEKQAANRDILRNLDVTGMLSEDESALLAEIYPFRTRGSGEPDEG